MYIIKDNSKIMGVVKMKILLKTYNLIKKVYIWFFYSHAAPQKYKWTEYTQWEIDRGYRDSSGNITEAGIEADNIYR